MRSLFLLFAFVCLTACSGSDSGEDWTTLFDGSDLDAFVTTGDANWTIGDDTVQANEGEGFLVTTGTFGDFELEVEFWADGPANSGVFLRCQDPEDISSMTCYEVNIFDTRPDQTYRTGGIVDVASPRAFVHAADRWNSFRITAVGTHLTVELNGVALVDADDSRLTSAGHIGLQRGAGTIMFRNVRIRPL